MPAQYERLITREVSENAVRLFKKAGSRVPINDDIYAYMLTINNGVDGKQTIDALICLNGKMLTILEIWEMVYNPKRGMFVARNENGEAGAYVKELSQKYINALLAILENVDIDGLTPPICLTPDIVQKIEEEIDVTVDSKHIDDSVIQKYAGVEMIEPVLAMLRGNLDDIEEKMGFGECCASYNRTDKVFMVVLPKRDIKLQIPLFKVVERKWVKGCILGQALYECVIESTFKYSA